MRHQREMLRASRPARKGLVFLGEKSTTATEHGRSRFSGRPSGCACDELAWHTDVKGRASGRSFPACTRVTSPSVSPAVSRDYGRGPPRVKVKPFKRGCAPQPPSARPRRRRFPGRSFRRGPPRLGSGPGGPPRWSERPPFPCREVPPPPNPKTNRPPPSISGA